MKIRAIRLKEVGRFSEPIALEGLSGDLDVLAGPNELGKSTILKAVRLALCEKHTSKDRKTVEALRPHNGGAPLVEVDFEIDGNTWRIRKQFLAGRSAELRSLSGSDVARGSDAETKLAELLAGKDAAGRFALLWVDQGKPLAPPSAEAAANGALLAAVEDEVESVTDGGAARFVGARLQAELAEFVTGHNPPRPTGRYKAAQDEQRDLAARRETARARLDGAQARLDRLGGVREKIARLADPAAATARAQAKADAERAFETGRAAHEKLRVAEEALEKHEERFHSCETALESLKAKIADLSKLEEAAVHEAPQLAELTRRLAEQESRTEAARKKRDEIKEALAAAEREGKAHVLGAQLRDLADRLKAARDAAGERKGLTDALAANGAEDGLLAGCSARSAEHRHAFCAPRSGRAQGFHLVCARWRRQDPGRRQGGRRRRDDPSDACNRARDRGHRRHHHCAGTIGRRRGRRGRHRGTAGTALRPPAQDGSRVDRGRRATGRRAPLAPDPTCRGKRTIAGARPRRSRAAGSGPCRACQARRAARTGADADA